MSHDDTIIPSIIPNPLDEGEEEPIPLGSRIVHKFYEPIMLLASLIGITKEMAVPRSPEPPIDIQDAKQVFHAFINKLGHICDSTKGGATVTSFMVLRSNGNRDTVHYWFAANRRTTEELQTTAAFVRELLHKVGQAPENPEQQHAIRKAVLYNILRFNRPRVSVYLRKLQPQVEECLRRCDMDERDEST